MNEYNNRRVAFYGGYFAALQDVVRDTGKSEWDHISDVINDLTKLAVYNVICETEKEVKAPHGTD